MNLEFSGQVFNFHEIRPMGDELLQTRGLTDGQTIDMAQISRFSALWSSLEFSLHRNCLLVQMYFQLESNNIY